MQTIPNRGVGNIATTWRSGIFTPSTGRIPQATDRQTEDTMFKTIATFAVVAAAFAATAPAQAGWSNGIDWNGFSGNGIVANGIVANGIGPNALTQNALTGNAISHNGTSKAATRFSIEGIELPAMR